MLSLRLSFRELSVKWIVWENARCISQTSEQKNLLKRDIKGLDERFSILIGIAVLFECVDLAKDVQDLNYAIVS